MNLAMLWYDPNPKTTFDQKVQGAIDYHRTKYGQTPNLCVVHPSMVPANISRVGQVEIRTNRSVRPNHFWIGVNNG